MIMLLCVIANFSSYQQPLHCFTLLFFVVLDIFLNNEYCFFLLTLYVAVIMSNRFLLSTDWGFRCLNMSVECITVPAMRLSV